MTYYWWSRMKYKYLWIEFFTFYSKICHSIYSQWESTRISPKCNKFFKWQVCLALKFFLLFLFIFWLIKKIFLTDLSKTFLILFNYSLTIFPEINSSRHFIHLFLLVFYFYNFTYFTDQLISLENSTFLTHQIIIYIFFTVFGLLCVYSFQQLI